ncbi:MAG: TonB-dependent receptor [Chitinophagales bacterium]|nr:MAG: TonB-dependent receptor [Chitinophagales bacterium]
MTGSPLFFVLYAVLFISGAVWAQPKSKDSALWIGGKVTDPAHQPIPYASVALFNTADSSLTTGTTTDEDGKFELTAEPGSYNLKITFLSYRTVTLPVLLGSSPLQLGKIIMQPDEKAIQEVEVVSEKSSMQLQLDKRVFNVGKDLSSTGSNALEVLDNVPSVSVDIDGNVSLRGSQNVRLLINGKPSSLTGISSTDALRMLQGSLIEKIEVITNPSARYDAEGEAGIINIVLKKEKNKGVNGSFDLTAGYPHNYSAAYQINFRKKWFNLFSSYGVHYRRNPGSGHTFLRYQTPDTTYSYESSRAHTRGGWGNTLKLGSDFYLNERNVLTVSGLFRFSKNQNKAETTYLDKDLNGVVIQTTERTDSEREDQRNWEASVHYEKTFKSNNEHKLTLDFQWSTSDDTENSAITETELASSSTLLQRSTNTEDEQRWLAQADYIHPFRLQGKFETGVKANWRFIQNDYRVEELSATGTWEPLPAFNDFFHYDENIYAAYVMAGDKIKKFSWQAGLRVEFSAVTTRLLESAYRNTRQYLDLFPSAHLSYEFNPNHTVQLSYSRRLSRPSFRWLLPFSGYSDARNYWSGNPDLNPEYTHSFELGYLKHWEKGSVLSSLYYRYRTGVIEQITLADSAGSTTRFPINLSTQHAFGIELNGNYDPFRWWKLTGSMNFYRSVTNGSYAGQSLQSDTYGWQMRASSRMTLFKKVDFQLTFGYKGPETTTQGKNKSSYSLDTGLSLDVFKGKGTLTLTGRDILNSRKRRSVVDTDTLYSESEFQWRSWQVLLNFNYRLNQKKKRTGALPSGAEEGGDF